MDDALRLTNPSKAAATYNGAADHFDALAFWDRYGRATVALLALPPGAQVLDVGCGTGASAIPAAEAVGPTEHVLGVDLAEGLLALARAKAAAQGLTNAEFRLGDMTALGFPDGQFDAVISVFSIFFVADMATQVRELWRMVKPGGQLAITTWGPDNFVPLSTQWRAAVRDERPDLYVATNPWERITTPEALGALLAEGGVTQAQITPEPGEQPLHTPEDWWTVVQGTGFRGTLDAMDAPTAARIHDRLVGYARDHNVPAVRTDVIYAIATKGA
jgi:SAM-dependent methyltransferase